MSSRLIPCATSYFYNLGVLGKFSLSVWRDPLPLKDWFQHNLLLDTQFLIARIFLANSVCSGEVKYGCAPSVFLLQARAFWDQVRL